MTTFIASVIALLSSLIGFDASLVDGTAIEPVRALSTSVQSRLETFNDQLEAVDGLSAVASVPTEALGAERRPVYLLAGVRS